MKEMKIYKSFVENEKKIFKNPDSHQKLYSKMYINIYRRRNNLFQMESAK